jgi:hypothetical protein
MRFPAPRGFVNHYFDVSPGIVVLSHCLNILTPQTPQETIDSHSEFGDDVYSAISSADFNTLGDLSPDAL